MRQSVIVVGIIVCLQAVSLVAQIQSGTLRVHVRAEDKPVEGAEVLVAGGAHQTDASGTAEIQVPAGELELTVGKSGYVTSTAKVTVTAGAQQDVTVDLQPDPPLEETVTVVATTRTNKRLEDQPMRVEVLEREGIEETMLMTPGDIVMMLNEMGGMRVQATSPSLGAASVRIQGMRGRYTDDHPYPAPSSRTPGTDFQAPLLPPTHSQLVSSRIRRRGHATGVYQSFRYPSRVLGWGWIPGLIRCAWLRS